MACDSPYPGGVTRFGWIKGLETRESALLFVATLRTVPNNTIGI